MYMVLFFWILGGLPQKGVFVPLPNPEINSITLISETIDIRKAKLFTEETNDLRTPCRFIVHLNHRLSKDDRDVLERNGLKVESYLPNSAFLVKGLPEKARDLLANGIINWFGSYKPDYKLDPVLLDKTEETKVEIMLFPGVELEEVTNALETMGVNIISAEDNEWNGKIIAYVKPLDFLKAASLDGVRWIEPFYEPVLHNNQAQWIIQTWKDDNRRIWDKGLHGEGIIGSTCDSGINTDHVMFKDSSIQITTWGDYPNHRKIIAYKPTTGSVSFGDVGGIISFHGTHTGCTVAGDDSYWGQSSPYDGMAPKSRLYFMDFDGYEYGFTADYRSMYNQPYLGNQAGRAKFSSNSWGDRGGGYTSHSWESDQFMWQHPEFLLLFSAGNSGGAIGSPATAKNMVTVGATHNGEAATMPADFSSIGPTADGRVKPEVMAPGVGVISANGGTADSYKPLDGTSMSCPVIAGAAALITQYFREGWYPGGVKNPSDSLEPSAALLKAALIVSTETDYSQMPIPNSKIGWGRPDLDSVLYFAGDSQKLFVFDESEGLSTGDYVSFETSVKTSGWPLRVALVWTDAPPELSAEAKLVNDLDLEVIDPSGKIYRGNNFSDNYSVQQGDPDSKNVVEMVRIKKPAAGVWSVRIKATEAPEGPQPYALLITGDIENHNVDLKSTGTKIDDSSGPSPNGALDPGETILFQSEITNIGDFTASGIEATLSTSEKKITIESDKASYGNLGYGESSYGDGFTVTASSEMQANTVVPFRLDVIANDGGYVCVLEYPVTISVGVSEKLPDPFMSVELTADAFNKDALSVRLSLPESGPLHLDMFDQSGRLVRTLVSESYAGPGVRNFQFKMIDSRGRSLSNGVYFFHLTTGNHSLVCKLVRIK